MKINLKVKSICKDIVVMLLITIFLFFLAEGFSSFILVFSKLPNAQILAERVHTEYDSLLGWINKRNFFIQDLYGPNKYLRTNSQRFRNNHDIDIDIPDGKRRWICSGDSFTLGYGVDNDNTWCSLLSLIVPDIETVNMGQGGYGLGQAYLWYMRDGIQLQHDVLVFAFITEDIRRMSLDHFLNYSKPRLNVQNGKIIKQNVPVPKPGFFVKHLPMYKPFIAQLSVVQLMNNLLEKLKGNASDIESVTAPLKEDQMMDALEIESVLEPLDANQAIEVTLSIFNTLNSFNKKFDRTVLLIHLPIQKDYYDLQTNLDLRNFFRSQAKANGWFYIDLIEEIRKLNSESISELFIQKDLPGFPLSKWHYTEKGNRYIAGLIVEKIASNSSIAKLVSTLK